MEKQDYTLIAIVVFISILLGIGILSLTGYRTDKLNDYSDCIQEHNIHNMHPEDAWKVYYPECRDVYDKQ